MVKKKEKDYGKRDTDRLTANAIRIPSSQKGLRLIYVRCKWLIGVEERDGDVR